jgi:hypothetical protein
VKTDWQLVAFWAFYFSLYAIFVALLVVRFA